jgi:hypothetical protein
MKYIQNHYEGRCDFALHNRGILALRTQAINP